MLYVVDAGVVAKWFFPEEESDIARTLLVNYTDQSDELMAPDFMLAEVANVLWKRSARGDITTEQAVNSLRYLTDLQVPLVPATELVNFALDIALQYGVAVYDALYLALSLERNCPLVTTDRRLRNAVRDAMPQVTLLNEVHTP